LRMQVPSTRRKRADGRCSFRCPVVRRSASAPRPHER
jgi:hypothetical protein